MSNSTHMKSWSLVLITAAAPLFVTAQNSVKNTNDASAAQQPESQTEQAINSIKNPVDWLRWGGDFRIRDEYFDNFLTLSPQNQLHEQNYLRFRARLWTSIKPVEDVSFNARFVTEPREWLRPAGYTTFRGRSGFDETEGVLDTLNVQWRNILGQAATLTVGRQDIVWGDGWLLGDGTPYDGSWSYYLDSARLNYEFKEQHTTV